MLDLWRTRRGLILASELLFLGFFALIWLTRWANPDLWHAWKGGEKPMDFAYLNAVIKSTEFPPYDPWFAGGYLNYYYFGQVMAGTLIKLIGIVPAVAYNLVVPAWYAMTAMGAFSVTYNLVACRGQSRTTRDGESLTRPRSGVPNLFGHRPRRTSPSPGPCAPSSLAFSAPSLWPCSATWASLPNLLVKLGEGMVQSFQSTIPGLAGLVRVTVGTFDMLFNGRVLPMRPDEWYWNASRAIPAGPYEAVITEFPFFTFLFADLHAHLIAMPLTFLSLAIGLAVILEAAGPQKVAGPQEAAGGQEGGWQGLIRRLGTLFLWALAIGAMRTTNTWDVPPHLIIVFGALVIAEATRQFRIKLTQGAITLKHTIPTQPHVIPM